MAGNVDELPLPDELPLIPDSWRYESLADLVEERGLSYGIVQPGNETTDGVPIVRVNNIRNGRIDTTNMLKVGADIEAKFRRSRLRGGEVLLTLVGTLGEVAIVPDNLRNWNVARAVAVIPVRKDPGSFWVSICLRSAFIQHCIRTWATTTVQATFNLRDLAKLPIPIPPTATREAIAGVLGALDDKIELNRRMNATLESMARALFQSWFVDFDPVRAKLDGRQPVGMDEETAGLFPEHLEESPLGNIPAGWKAGTVVDGFNLTMGQSPPGETYNEESKGIPFYQGRTDFGFRYPIRRIYCTMPTRYAKPGDTLVSVRAPVGDINMANEDCCIGRGVAAVRHKSGATAFTYHSMAKLYPDFARFEAEGTVFGSINKNSFEKLRFVIPPDEIIVAYERQAGAFDEEIRILENQSRILATLRDSFLPKLLSGELSVAEASRNADITG